MLLHMCSAVDSCHFFVWFLPCQYRVLHTIILLTDSFHRVHDYLRISLTDNCNLRCFYCMPDEEISCTSRENLMSADEIEKIASVFVKLGVKKIRLTGGEPLVRKEASDILGRLSKLPVELTLTTNGILLHRFIDGFADWGIKSVNISLDTLDKDRFIFITRRNEFERVMSNIDRLLASHIHVKINVVVMKGVNEHEIRDFVRWTVKSPVHIRFIEFMPFAGNQWHGDKVFSLESILNEVSQEFDFIPLGKEPHATASKFFVPGSAGSFAIIGTMTHPFCGDCNRMRLTADGKMKNCLFSANETDLLGPIRAGLNIEPLIVQSVQSKKEKLGGQLLEDFTAIDPSEINNRSMITIGG